MKQKILRYFWLSDYVKQICGINPVNSFVDVRIGTIFFTSYLFVLLLSTTLRIKVNLIYFLFTCYNIDASQMSSKTFLISRREETWSQN